MMKIPSVRLKWNPFSFFSLVKNGKAFRHPYFFVPFDSNNYTPIDFLLSSSFFFKTSCFFFHLSIFNPRAAFLLWKNFVFFFFNTFTFTCALIYIYISDSEFICLHNTSSLIEYVSNIQFQM